MRILALIAVPFVFAMCPRPLPSAESGPRESEAVKAEKVFILEVDGELIAHERG